MATLTQRYHFFLSRVHGRLGHPGRAERALTRATSGPAADPGWLHRLATARRRANDHAGAADALARAIDRRADAPPRWYYELGRASELAGRMEDADAAYRRWTAHDPLPRGLDAVLLDRGVLQFVPRRDAVRFVLDRLAELRAAAGARQVVEDRSDTVWTYWAQGFDQAPDVVRMCRSTMARHLTRPVVELDDDNVGSFVTLPDDIDALVTDRTARSDLLRLELLARYGGTWLDATCYLRGDAGAELADHARPTGFFAPAKERTSIGTWSITAQPGHYLVTMTLEALYAYWRKDGKLPHYFTFHHLFEALVLTDPRFGELFAATPRLSTAPSLRLRHWMSRDMTDEDFERALSRATVHKLSYKAGSENTGPRSVLGRLYAAEAQAAGAGSGGTGRPGAP
ncbi:capsular polysaccharide synthesis protein [Promicromonospora sp. NPDC050880]|uniref:capsular polysaccharide synthesis protein n=1 Tax=unclassified Promicromonospora TaxID=2647929 RepID=UPI00378D7559